MACTETGAVDHFTNMEEKEMAMIPIVIGIITGILNE
jgi:hypothetical protein